MSSFGCSLTLTASQQHPNFLEGQGKEPTGMAWWHLKGYHPPLQRSLPAHDPHMTCCAETTPRSEGHREGCVLL